MIMMMMMMMKLKELPPVYLFIIQMFTKRNQYGGACFRGDGRSFAWIYHFLVCKVLGAVIVWLADIKVYFFVLAVQMCNRDI